MDLAEPGERRQPARLPADRDRPRNPAQVIELLDTVRDQTPALYCYLTVATSTGARRSQLLALRWGDVDFERAAVSFTRALVEGPAGPELRPTKNGRPYRVAVDTSTLGVIADHRRGADERARLGRQEVNGTSFVFSHDPDGRRPWRPNWITKRFIDARRAAGLAHFRLHDLRHFMATQMLAAGVPIATVSQRLSHARVSTTLNVYAHSIPGGDEHAAETLAAILADARRAPG